MMNYTGGVFVRVSISKGNEKLGSIQSVSLPSGVTCRECDCQKKCYARRIERRRKSVRDAYQNNLAVLHNEPDTYWREVEATVMLSRYFRFHVSGDIPSSEYFERMVDIAKRNSHCEILCFTKKYEIVNEYISNTYRDFIRGTSIRPQCYNLQMVAEQFLPKNLHIIMSGWRGLDMSNPYNLPEAHVRYRDGTTTASDKAKECSGNCTECAITDEGCWTLGYGEQVVFNEH